MMAGVSMPDEVAGHGDGIVDGAACHVLESASRSVSGTSP
jgi:hypothetical protein